MDQKEEKIQRMTPEIEAEMDAFVAEYDRKIAAGECIYTDEPFEDFTEARENLRKMGVKPKPWGWWLEENKQKVESPS